VDQGGGPHGLAEEETSSGKGMTGQSCVGFHGIDFAKGVPEGLARHIPANRNAKNVEVLGIL
jgi:hypothetical protein